MTHKYLFRFFRKGSCPFHQSLIIRMTADTRKNFDLGIDLNLFSKQFDFFYTFYQCPSRRTDCLITNKQNRALRSPQIMFQVMFDPAGITHATG